ncbi:Ada metal-binding domain-containing protein [Aeromicrobium sp. REDSEA-S32_B7]|uniref:DNA-3-methyladenine glycosylase 2 family protein n=1 Tax=Aeromicrobium sp. REDSEA-S32_B7 TaxID=1811526 RepID=UPI000A9EDEB7|nr:Ada metal-binding domain-containing protein [Aeromicrobium sp. REDSEA-S32_B7]
MDDVEAQYRAVSSRDERFDGVFFTAVRTTGIYCRPSCPARTPRRENVEFHRSAASAEAAGFRACRRCRPDSTPGSPEWDVRADVVGRAVRLVRDGVVEREGVPGLASRLGYSERHVTRMLTQELGAGPLALATSQRTRTARVLVETTDLSMADIAFASGFSSVRQFNDAFRRAFARTPTELRAHGPAGTRGGGALPLRLAVRQPFHADALAGFLADHAVPGLERGDGRLFARVLTLPHGNGAAEMVLHDDHVAVRLELADQRDLTAAVARLRHLLDLVSGARTVLGRVVATAGEPVTFDLAHEHSLTHAFPTADALATLDPETLPMPRSRGRTVVGLAHAVAVGDLSLDVGVDRDEASRTLLALPGIGPWTVGYVRMRGLGDPDVLLDTDLVLRRILDARGATTDDVRHWSPWRSYAGMHLWTEHLARQAEQRTRGSRA